MNYTKFTIRTKIPTKENKHYVTRSNGGWSTCVKGKPDYECDVLSNCVGYCCGRFNEIYEELSKVPGQEFPYFNCNAENFIERAKEYYPNLEIGQEPRPGAIMVWQKGETLSSKDGCGHVAIIEKVIDENNVMTSESSWGSEIFFWTRTRTKGDGNWGFEGKFRGCIYNPLVKEIKDEEFSSIEEAIKKINTKNKDTTSSTSSTTSLKYKLNDIVEYTGVIHYSSPTSEGGKACKPGVAKITSIELGGKHQYHLIREKSLGTGTVWGWVDEEYIKEWKQEEIKIEEPVVESKVEEIKVTQEPISKETTTIEELQPMPEVFVNPPQEEVKDESIEEIEEEVKEVDKPKSFIQHIIDLIKKLFKM